MLTLLTSLFKVVELFYNGMLSPGWSRRVLVDLLMVASHYVRSQVLE
jgi:hypothetical protein